MDYRNPSSYSDWKQYAGPAAGVAPGNFASMGVPPNPEDLGKFAVDKFKNGVAPITNLIGKLGSNVPQQPNFVDQSSATPDTESDFHKFTWDVL